jgi:hypothetical protein
LISGRRGIFGSTGLSSGFGAGTAGLTAVFTAGTGAALGLAGARGLFGAGFGTDLGFEAGLDAFFGTALGVGVFFTTGAAFFKGFLADLTGALAFAAPRAGFLAVLDVIFPVVFFVAAL